MPGFLSSRPNWGIGTPHPLTRKRVLIPLFASKEGDTLAWGERGGPNSDYGTYTGTLGILQYLRTRKSISVSRYKRIYTRSLSRVKTSFTQKHMFPRFISTPDHLHTSRQHNILPPTYNTGMQRVLNDL